MTVTPAILKTHAETDLVDAALQRLIDAANSDITLRAGLATTITEEFDLYVDGLSVARRRIWTRQTIGTLTSVKHGLTIKSADLTLLVENTDFTQVFNGKAIEKLGNDFQPRVVIVYTPVTDEDRRDRVVIDLCKLSIQYNGLNAEKIGDWSGSQSNYDVERERILASLLIGRRAFA